MNNLIRGVVTQIDGMIGTGVLDWFGFHKLNVVTQSSFEAVLAESFLSKQIYLILFAAPAKPFC